jgi:hypothetical protein
VSNAAGLSAVPLLLVVAVEERAVLRLTASAAVALPPLPPPPLPSSATALPLPAAPTTDATASAAAAAFAARVADGEAGLVSELAAGALVPLGIPASSLRAVNVTSVTISGVNASTFTARLDATLSVSISLGATPASSSPPPVPATSRRRLTSGPNACQQPSPLGMCRVEDLAADAVSATGNGVDVLSEVATVEMGLRQGRQPSPTVLLRPSQPVLQGGPSAADCSSAGCKSASTMVPMLANEQQALSALQLWPSAPASVHDNEDADCEAGPPARRALQEDGPTAEAAATQQRAAAAQQLLRALTAAAREAEAHLTAHAGRARLRLRRALQQQAPMSPPSAPSPACAALSALLASALPPAPAATPLPPPSDGSGSASLLAVTPTSQPAVACQTPALDLTAAELAALSGTAAQLLDLSNQARVP